MTNFIEHAKGLTKNPLGIIALFVSLIYGFACLVLSTSISNLHDSSERLPLIWFIIIFPITILAGFIFLVVNHHGKLYSPSDYGNTESFLSTLEGAKKFEPVQIEIEKNDLERVKDTNGLVRKFEDINLNKSVFSPETRENVALANKFFDSFRENINQRTYRIHLEELTFGAQAPEYFFLSCKFKKEVLKSERTSPKEEVIIRVTRDSNDVLRLIAIGKDIIETNPKEFANKLTKHFDNFAKRTLKD